MFGGEAPGKNTLITTNRLILQKSVTAEDSPRLLSLFPCFGDDDYGFPFAAFSKVFQQMLEMVVAEVKGAPLF